MTRRDWAMFVGGVWVGILGLGLPMLLRQLV